MHDLQIYFISLLHDNMVHQCTHMVQIHLQKRKKKARLLYIKLKRLMLHVYQLILISLYFDFNKSFLLLFL